MRFRSSAGLALLLLTGCFQAPSCALDWDDCQNDFDCGDAQICADDTWGNVCEDRRLCSEGCRAGETCVTRPGLPSPNPFESDLPGKQVCEPVEEGGSGGFGGSGGSGGFGGSGGSGGSGGFGGDPSCGAPPTGDVLNVTQLGGMESDGGALLTPDASVMAFAFRGQLAGDGGAVSAGESDVALLGRDEAGQVAWQRVLGDESANAPTALAGSFGTVAVATPFTGTIDAGTGPVDAGAGPAALVVGVGKDGSTAWAHALRSDIDVMVTALSFTGEYRLFVAGSFTGKLDLGGATLQSTAGQDAFVASYKTATMELEWAHQLGGNGDQSVAALASDGAGNVYVAGTFDGELMQDDDWLALADGPDAFVLRIPSGQFDKGWHRVFGGPDRQVVTAMALAPDLGVVVAGARGSMTPSPGYVDLGNGLHLEGSGLVDGFAARLDKGGTVAWGRLFAGAPGAGEVVPGAVAVGCGGAILVAGSATDGAAFGADPLAAAGGHDAFVHRMDSNGYAQWSSLFGGAGEDGATGLGVLPDRIVVGGAFTGAAAFGPLAAESAGAEDAFVLEVSP